MRLWFRRRLAELASLDHGSGDALLIGWRGELDRRIRTERDPVEVDAVARAMTTLSSEHRVVLSLFAIAGLTHAEIAETLGVPEGTVWSRLHHAKRKLGELLSGAPAAG